MPSDEGWSFVIGEPPRLRGAAFVAVMECVP